VPPLPPLPLLPLPFSSGSGLVPIVMPTVTV
jgi:hypothetical protein